MYRKAGISKRQQYETNAIYWEDVDFEKKTLAINHNLLQYINCEN